MSDRYKPHFQTDPKVDPARCRAPVWENHRSYQCLKKHKKGSEWCGTHDPARVAERRARSTAKSEARWAEERRRRVAFGLKEATAEQLRAELLRRKESE